MGHGMRARTHQGVKNLTCDKLRTSINSQSTFYPFLDCSLLRFSCSKASFKEISSIPFAENGSLFVDLVRFWLQDLQPLIRLWPGSIIGAVYRLYVLSQCRVTVMFACLLTKRLLILNFLGCVCSFKLMNDH